MFIRLFIFYLAFSCVFLCSAGDKAEKKEEKLSANTLALMTYQELEKESFDSLNANKLDFSLKYFAEMLKRQKTKSSPDETKLGLIYYGQGKVFQKKGDFNKAIKNFDKALALLKDKPIPPEIKTSLYSCAGSAYSSNGNIKKALHWEEKAFELAKQTYGLENQWTAAYLACLATSHYENHDYSKAIKLLEQSYLILTKLNGENDKNTLRVKEKLEEWKKKISSDALAKMTYKDLDNKGIGYFLSKKFDLSMMCFKEMLKRENAKKNPNPEKLFSIYYSLARNLQSKEEYCNSVKYFKKAVEIAENNKIEDLSTMIELYSYYGAANIHLGKLKKAMQLNQIALYLAEKKYGKASPRTATKIIVSAVILHKQGNLSEAINLLEKANSILKNNSKNKAGLKRLEGILSKWKKEKINRPNQ